MDGVCDGMMNEASDEYFAWELSQQIQSECMAEMITLPDL